MPVLSKAGESHELTTDSAYAFLKHTLNWPPASIAHLAIDKKFGEWQLSELPEPSGKQTRACVLLSGRPQQAVLNYWRDHPDNTEMDFFVHMWNSDVVQLNALTFQMTDTKEVNEEVRRTLQLPNEVDNYIIVHRDADADMDDVSRINNQLYGIACVFAMAVLNAAITGITYDTFIRCRSDFMPGKFRLSLRPPEPRPLKWFMASTFNMEDKYAKWSWFYDDRFYLGGLDSMAEICLLVENWKVNIKLFLLGAELNKPLENLVASLMLRPSKADRRQLVVRAIEQRNVKYAWQSTGFGWIKWFHYTPETLIRFLVDSKHLAFIKIDAEILNDNHKEVIFTEPFLISKENTRAFVINLDDNPGRLAETLQELKRIQEIVGLPERVDAVRATPGWQGCRQSHLKVLQKALEDCSNDIQHFAIFEDDFMWCKWCDDPQAIISPVNVQFDVLMLNYTPRPGWRRIEQVSSTILRLFETYSTAGYIVHKRFLQTLYDFWMTHTDEHIDKSWQKLQDNCIFIGIAPCPTNQRPQISTISQSVNYGEPQIILFFPPRQTQVTQFARTMFVSRAVFGHDERIAAAKEAVSSRGHFDCAVVVEKKLFLNQRELVKFVIIAIDYALSRKTRNKSIDGFTVFCRNGTLNKQFWH
jgi:hypothetical protein